MSNLIPQPQSLPHGRQSAEPSQGDAWETSWSYAPGVAFPPSSRGRRKWRAYAGSAGALLLTLGVGLAAADRISGGFGAAAPDPVEVKATEALNAAQSQKQEIAALRVHVETLRNKLEAQAQKSRADETTIASLQKSLADEKADVASSASQLQAKIEKVQSQAAEKAAERGVDRTPTASIPKPLPRPAQIQAQVQANTQAIMKQVGAAPPAPAPYRAFVLRDVGPGRALVEGEGRIEEVEPGDILPGGAVVERIERHGQRWVVMTDRGFIGPDEMWDN
jgi:hypothetical protein